MYFSPESSTKRKSKSAKKFDAERPGVQSLKSRNSLKSKIDMLEETDIDGFSNQLEESQIEEIVKQYEENAYFRKKLDKKLAQLHNSDENEGKKLIFQDKDRLKEINMQTLSQKLSKEKKARRGKLQEIDKQIKKQRQKNKIK